MLFFGVVVAIFCLFILFLKKIAKLRLLIYSAYNFFFVGELKLYKISAEKCLLILLTLVHSGWLSYCFFFTFSSSCARIVSVCCVGYNEFFPGSSSQELYSFSCGSVLETFSSSSVEGSQVSPLWRVTRCFACVAMPLFFMSL